MPPKDVAKWKPRLEWFFASFCRAGDLDPETLWQDVEDKKRQLWLVDDNGVKAAVLTAVVADNFKTCDVTHAAGHDRASWLDLWPALEHWARDIGCKRIRAIARPGWERVLPLKKTHVVLEGRL